MKHILFFVMLCLFSRQSITAQSIHIFGDSHAHYNFSNLPAHIYHPKQEKTYLTFKTKKIPCTINWLGPRTMHRVGRDGLSFLDLRSFGIKKNDIALFVFGEIDARVHIGRQAIKQKKTIARIITMLVKNYYTALQEKQKLCKNITIVIATVIPPCDRGYNDNFPTYGTLEDRVKITQLLNKELISQAQKYNFFIVDTYSLFANKKGILPYEMSNGSLHVGRKYNNHSKDALISVLNKHNFIL